MNLVLGVEPVPCERPDHVCEGSFTKNHIYIYIPKSDKSWWPWLSLTTSLWPHWPSYSTIHRLGVLQQCQSPVQVVVKPQPPKNRCSKRIPYYDSKCFLHSLKDIKSIIYSSGFIWVHAWAPTASFMLFTMCTTTAVNNNNNNYYYYYYYSSSSSSCCCCCCSCCYYYSIVPLKSVLPWSMVP